MSSIQSKPFGVSLHFLALHSVDSVECLNIKIAIFFLASFINGLKTSASLDSKINVANLFTSCSGNNFFKANISFSESLIIKLLPLTLMFHFISDSLRMLHRCLRQQPMLQRNRNCASDLREAPSGDRKPIS